MDSRMLTLRQRKLLLYLQNQNHYVTGHELAIYLQISSRTVRSDITDMNQKLSGSGILIISQPSLGYTLSTDDESKLMELSLASSSFLTREDRVRHMVFRLCLSDVPVSLDDLEDEMFVSRTTLEHDLTELRRKYVLTEPYIQFTRSRNRIYFNNNERKRRKLLNLLFSENWNYNSRGNSYYQYQYLDKNVVNLIMDEIQLYVRKYHIMMEDINMVITNLAIAIAYYRIRSGHLLPTDTGDCNNPFDPSKLDPQRQDSYETVVAMVNDLLSSLEQELDCHFPETERYPLYAHVSYSIVPDMEMIAQSSITQHIPSQTIRFANRYITRIQEIFHIDFSDNQDFYITLTEYLRYLGYPEYHLSVPDNYPDASYHQLMIEYEIAFLIQDLASEYLGNYLNDKELLHLAFCISGALEYQKRTNPKLRTVIMCHMNLTISWYLKQKILNVFNDYIDLVALLPVYSKSGYDFSNTDLIITTVNKTITKDYPVETLVISPYFSKDDRSQIEKHIFHSQINQLYSPSLQPLSTLFAKAFWHEEMVAEDALSVFEQLSGDFMEAGYVGPEYLQELLRREAIMSFVNTPGIAVIYSLAPSTRTCLSVGILAHRIRWNGQKIRVVLMAAMEPEHRSLIFKLINELYYGEVNPENFQHILTKQKLIELF